MGKWKIVFSVLWEHGERPKQQIIRVKAEERYVVQLADALNSCETVSSVKIEREQS